MKIETLVFRKIDEYKPKGELAHTAKMFLSISSVKHNKVKGHVERVALMAEKVAKILKYDSKAAFFAGLMHDIGKLVLPYSLFEDKDITPQEYNEIKSHAIAGYKMLKNKHMFTALCAGLHHALYESGYGLTIADFPRNWNPKLIRKVLDVAAIVSICDFIDAFTHRHTKILDGSDKKPGHLEDMLKAKYPDDQGIIEAALRVSNERIFQPR
jgi:putative nucleotidyltransferase with HDIG domain